MKRYLKGIYMSLGMFTAIPMPFLLWDEACLHFLLPCLPVIGILIGALWWGIGELLMLGAVHVVLAAAVLALVPFLLTGFLHLDGYMDTSDAVLSRRPLEDKLRIIKDPHVGAFAVIMLAVLFVLQFATAYAVIDGGKNLAMLLVIPIVSRACGSLAQLNLQTLSQSSYANMFKENSGVYHKIFVIALTLLAGAASWLFMGWLGLVVVMVEVIGFWVAMAYVYNEFKGVSGDLTGFSLIISELCGLMVLAVL